MRNTIGSAAVAFFILVVLRHATPASAEDHPATQPTVAELQKQRIESARHCMALNRAEGGAAVAQSLQGTWKVVKKVKNGESEDVAAHPSSLKIAGDKVTAMEGDESKGEGTFTIDESTTPKRITMNGKTGPNAGRTFEAIFELDGDTLKLAYSIGDKAGTPPTDFSGGQGTAAETLERVKP